jgi:hypothetical protein
MSDLDWEYYENLLKKYSENCLLDLLREDNLQPYDNNGEPIYCPHNFHEYFHISKTLPQGSEYKSTLLTQIVEAEFPDEDEHGEPLAYSDPNFHNKWSWKFLRVPEDETEKEALRLILKNSKFKKSVFDNFIKSKEVESSNPSAQRKKQFSTSSKTEWSNIKIEFVDLENVEISFEYKVHKRSYTSYDYFYHKNTKKWRLGWKHLMILAEFSGNPPAHHKGTKDKITKKQVSDLQIALEHIFPNVDGKPFKRYKSGQGWEPLISLSLSEHISGLYTR